LYYLGEYINVVVSFGLEGYLNRIDPHGEVNIYSQKPWRTWGDDNFRKLDSLEQLKVIYTKFSVKDEDGIEILNLDTMTPDDFEIKTHSDFWQYTFHRYLIIK
jgi:hypothetical protein